jgi:hypothetical protein
MPPTITDTELGAICARHGIRVDFSPDFYWYADAEDYREGVSGCDDKAHAVCDLLKARWKITTHPSERWRGMWSATHAVPKGFVKHTASDVSELDAVVKMADWLVEEASRA